MKRLLVSLMLLALISTTVLANERIEKQESIDEKATTMLKTDAKYVADFEVAISPVSIVNNYYDYFPGGYSSTPIRRVEGMLNGNWIVYHAKATPSSQRRVYKAFVDQTGNVVSNTLFNTNDVGEGYATVDLTANGEPFFAYHGNNDSDDQLETIFGYDAVLGGSVVDMNSDPFTVIDNFASFEVNGTSYDDNEFIWPTLKIGPSPLADHQRIYVMGKNATQNGSGVSENVLIYFKDFTETEIEYQSLDSSGWQVTSIPTLNEWNVSTGEFRRPYFTFVVHEDNLYYVGYHIAAEGIETDDASINEADLDVFRCSNYGEGEWERFSVYAGFESSNPNYINPTGDHQGTELDKEYFDQQEDHADSDFYIGIGQSSHFNVSVDEIGRLHIPLFYTQKTFEGSYYPALHVIKDVTFDTNTEEFTLTEVYPQSSNPTIDLTNNTDALSTETPWLWWDADSDGIVDEILDDGTYDGTDDGVTAEDTDYWGSPVLTTLWPYQYWDETIDDNKMMFALHMVRITEANEEGMMAMVWHDSKKARMYNKYPEDYPEYSDFAQQAEVMIAVSADNGISWSEPMALSSVGNTEFAGQTIAFADPGNKIDYIGTDDQGNKVGRLHLFYMDDSTYGPSLQGVGQDTQGSMMYSAIDIHFNGATPNNDSSITPVASMLNQNYPNPFNPETTISFNVQKAGPVSLNVYNSKGQLVKTLVNDSRSAGTHNVVWNGQNNKGQKVSSGLYFYKIKNAGKSQMKKMVLMK